MFINEHKLNLFKWLIRFFQEKEKEEFLKYVTMGGSKIESNPLFQAKRGLDITVKGWREDLIEGLLSKDELIEEDYPYTKVLVNSLIKGIKRDYTAMRSILSRWMDNDIKDGTLGVALMNIKVDNY